MKAKKITNTLEQKEASAISAAIAEGHHDPLKGEHRPAFFQGDDRRYATNFVKLSYNDLVSNQVGVVEVDKTRAQEELKPKLLKEGKVLNPILVTRRRDGKYKIEGGHHRAYVLQLLGWDIPAFVLSPFYNSTGPASVFSEQKGRIQTNHKSTTKQYTMKDVEREYYQAFDTDPTFEGKNPLGIPLLRSTSCTTYDFDDFMDEFFPGWFESEAVRTRIHNRCKARKNLDQIIEIDASDITSALANLGWDTGLKKGKRRGKDSRLPFTKHICGTSLVLIADSHVQNVEGKIYTLMRNYHLNTEGFKNFVEEGKISKIKVLGSIYDKDGSITSNSDKLDLARISFKQVFEDMNKMLESTNTPFKITTLEMMKQSKSPTDTGETFKF